MIHQFRGVPHRSGGQPGPQDDTVRKRMNDAGINPGHIG
jgi:hypothetical protein